MFKHRNKAPTTKPAASRAASRQTTERTRTTNTHPVSHGAEHHRVRLLDRLHGWQRHHHREALAAFRRLWRTPVASTMTLAVLAIALALPAFMYSALNNLQQLTSGLYTEPHISLYLQPDLDADEVNRFSDKLMRNADVAQIETVSASQGLRDFKRYSRFADMLDLFDHNPLPAVIVVTPRSQQPAALAALRVSLASASEVDEARLDMEWVQRLKAFTDLARRGAWVLGALLALTVLLVVGNTVRMTIESRRDEIVVSKLVGATDAWVRRPFLYSGFWFGVCGAVMGWILAEAGIMLIEGPLQQLVRLYLNNYEVQGLGFGSSVMLLVCGTLLGLLGSWIAVSRHLSDIEPR